jgi:pimeloyl-ACP methyl ester carboxylesterase
MAHVRSAVEEAWPQAKIFVPPLPLGRFSFANAASLARSVFEEIDRMVVRKAAAGAEYDDIVLGGHSIGGLLARRIYVLACGETEKAPFEDSPEDSLEPRKDWADKVTRIVLLAGMNRGWSISHHMGLLLAAGMTIGTFLANIWMIFTRKRMLIFQIRRGAPFLTQLRLQWIAMERQAFEEKRKSATVVQLLGSVDDLVSPEDNLDLVAGQSFVYLDVPWSGHENVILMDETPEGRARKAVFLRALTDSEGSLTAAAALPFDEKPRLADDSVSDVIFVIHGIRDAGHWTQKIARCVQRAGNQPPKIYSMETSTYGYFAMFSFLLPSRRRAKVEWLMDQFAEAQALYPTAKFSFVGHSNGTYLLAKALKDYRACRFENVVFAGSVVPRSYDWIAAQQRGQVKAILNYVASRDLIVAWFPGAIELLHLQDLGSAGHNGFDQLTRASAPRLYQCGPVPGGHAAALREENWKAIAHFIVHGEPMSPPAAAIAERRSWWVVLGGWLSPFIWVGILVGLYFISRWIWERPIAEWQRTLAEVAFVWVVWKIFTRV